MPYQVSDNLEHILIAQSQSLRELLVDRVTGPGSVRPLMWWQQKVLFDLSPSNGSFAAFKAFHVVELLLVVMLFVRLVRVRTSLDFVVLPLALAALLGMHTFNVTVREGYPVNHFLTVLVCCLVAVNLALSRGTWWRDLAAVATFIYALLTIETGVLVWVCLAAGYAVGWRGVSWKGVAGATVVLAAYVILRFFVLDTGGRALGAASSGYGFSTRSPAELIALFGDAPWRFYAYNIMSAGLTVLFSEPRGGVFQFTSFAMRGEIPPWSAVNVLVSAIGTAFIVLHVARRVSHWRQGALEHEDRLLILFAAVLVANAAISYPYTKEVVMSPAGMFYAAAVFVALRDVLLRIPLGSRVPAGLVAVPLLILSLGWTLRTVTLVATMRETAFVNRSDWAVAEERHDQVRRGWRARHPDAERVLRALREEVIRMPVPPLYQTPRWAKRWLDPY
jgi:hypothetical protein